MQDQFAALHENPDLYVSVHFIASPYSYILMTWRCENY